MVWHIVVELKNANSHTLIFFKERQISTEEGRELMNIRDYIKSLLPLEEQAHRFTWLATLYTSSSFLAAVTGIGIDPLGSSFPAILWVFSLLS